MAYPKLEVVLPHIEDIALIGAFLAFLLLLGSGALGFLVSQVWYVIYNHIISGRYGKFPEITDLLRQEYGLTEDRHRQKIFSDYVHRLSDKQTLIYTQRRYDLMHICGSTFVTTLIGSLIGLSIRFDWFKTDTTLEAAIKSLSSVSLGIPEITTYDFGVILMVASLLFLLSKSLWYVCKEHAMAFDFTVRKVVNSGSFPLSKAREVFTNDYFNNENRKRE